MRILLTVEYDGTAYSGWQRQENAPSVQQTLEEAIYKATDRHAAVTGAGRTDAGVHAAGQCAHFDTDTTIPPEKLAFALNAVLPRDIRVRESRQVSDSFHARKSARGKHYRYAIYNSPHDCAICRQYRAHIRYPLDEKRMSEAAELIAGTHDFACFKAAGSTPVATTVRTITGLTVTRSGEMIYIDVRGTGFLYNMVRIIAGTLIEVGSGKREPKSIAALIESGNRDNSGPTAAAKGLVLAEVFYDSRDLLSEESGEQV